MNHTFRNTTLGISVISLVSRNLYLCGICLKVNVLRYVSGENTQNKFIQIQLLSAQYPDKTYLAEGELLIGKFNDFETTVKQSAFTYITAGEGMIAP